MINKLKKRKFKETDIGRIPETWEVKTFCEVFELLDNMSDEKELCFKGNDFKCFFKKDLTFNKEKTFDLSKNKLSEFGKDNIKKLPTLLKNGDLVAQNFIGKIDLEKSLEIKNIGNQKVVAGHDVFAFRDRNNVFLDGFRGYLLESTLLRSCLLSPDDKNFKIPVPSQEEQKRILDSLSELAKLRDWFYEFMYITKRDLLAAKVQIIKMDSSEKIDKSLKKDIIQNIVTKNTRFIVTKL